MGNSKIKKPDSPIVSQSTPNGRRSFIKKATAASVTIAGANLFSLAVNSCISDNLPENKIPWFRRVKRWGQVNITLDNAANFDIAWWRKYWKRTNTQGIVLNAGGILCFLSEQSATSLQGSALRRSRSFWKIFAVLLMRTGL